MLIFEVTLVVVSWFKVEKNGAPMFEVCTLVSDRRWVVVVSKSPRKRRL